MRFIRKNGRIIPIRDKEEAESLRKSSTKASIAAGGLYGLSSVTATETVKYARKAMMTRDPKLKSSLTSKFKKSAILSVGLIEASFGAGLYSAVKDNQAQKLDPKSYGENFKRGLSDLGKGLIVTAAVIGGYKGLIVGGTKLRTYTQNIPDIKTDLKDKFSRYMRNRGSIKTKGRSINPNALKLPYKK